jgi:hypothetical protein
MLGMITLTMTSTMTMMVSMGGVHHQDRLLSAEEVVGIMADMAEEVVGIMADMAEEAAGGEATGKVASLAGGQVCGIETTNFDVGFCCSIHIA